MAVFCWYLSWIHYTSTSDTELRVHIIWVSSCFYTAFTPLWNCVKFSFQNKALDCNCTTLQVLGLAWTWNLQHRHKTEVWFGGVMFFQGRPALVFHTSSSFPPPPLTLQHGTEIRKQPRRNESVSCPVCHKRLSRKRNLKAHLDLHCGIYPYYCPVCKKGFSSKTSLRIHVASHKQDTGQGQSESVGRGRVELCSAANLVETVVSSDVHESDHMKICPYNTEFLTA